MGEVSSDPYPLLSDPVIGMPGLAEEAADLAGRHEMQTSAELELLIDYLFGLSCRDQAENEVKPAEMAERRRVGFALAKTMRREAAKMLISLEQLHEAYRAFEQIVRFDPSLLEAIFTVDTGGPEELFLPPELGILQTAFSSSLSGLAMDHAGNRAQTATEGGLLDPFQPCPAAFWENVDARLQLLANLPVSSALARGPVPNIVLNRAVARCRDFWARNTQHSWTKTSLKHAQVRRELHPETAQKLQGRCEKFVADILLTAGLRFNFAQLASAWDAVDKAARAECSEGV